MRRRGHWRKWAKWAGIGACAVILAAWGVSEIWRINFRRSVPAIWSSDGSIVALKAHLFGRTGSSPVWIRPLGENDRSFGFVLPKLEIDDDWFRLILPFWCLLLLAGVPTALLFYLDRRKIVPGHCKQCGYDVHTMTSGRCPECGLAPTAKG